MLPFFKLCALFGQRDKYFAAEYFRIGIRRLAEKVFIEGLDGEYRGIYARQGRGEGYELVAP